MLSLALQGSSTSAASSMGEGCPRFSFFVQNVQLSAFGASDSQLICICTYLTFSKANSSMLPHLRKEWLMVYERNMYPEAFIWVTHIGLLSDFAGASILWLRYFTIYLLSEFTNTFLGILTLGDYYLIFSNGLTSKL